MVHWIFILVGFAFGFFFGACSVFFGRGKKKEEERKKWLRS